MTSPPFSRTRGDGPADDMINGLVEAIGDALDDDGDDERGARAAIAYLAGQAPVEAGPEPSPGTYAVTPEADPEIAAFVHRANHWDALRAQLVAMQAERDAALAEVERLQEVLRATIWRAHDRTKETMP